MILVNLKAFNAKLSELIAEAKRVEKANPRNSIPYWIETAEFCLKFAKSPGLDRRIGVMIRKKTEDIIKRVKAMKGGAVEQTGAGQGIPVDNQVKPSANIEALGEQLPSPPTGPAGGGLGTASDDLPDANSATTRPTATAPGDGSGQPPDTGEGFPGEDISALMKTLGDLPDGFKEVTPGEYDGTTIIPPSGKSSGFDIDSAKDFSLDFDQFKVEEISFDIPPSQEGGEGAKSGGNTGVSPRRDPFADASPFEGGGGDGDDLACFACGAKVPHGAKKCPSCGVELRKKKGKQ
ncbi:MAG: zinc ribbon domain-containing protein [Promethearchaeota archaeon]